MLKVEQRRNKRFYDVLTFIPNQDTVHCEPPWWKTTSTWNLMLNDPILNVLFLCFMSLTLTPTKIFYFFFADCKRSPLWNNCHCQNVPSGQPPKVRIIKEIHFIITYFIAFITAWNMKLDISQIILRSKILKQHSSLFIVGLVGSGYIVGRAGFAVDEVCIKHLANGFNFYF